MEKGKEGSPRAANTPEESPPGLGTPLPSNTPCLSADETQDRRRLFLLFSERTGTSRRGRLLVERRAGELGSEESTGLLRLSGMTAAGLAWERGLLWLQYTAD